MAKVLRNSVHLWIACPACGVSHRFDDKWTFNGDVDIPTFFPRLKTLHIENGKNTYCFARVIGGLIEFDPTSRHYLAGQTVPLPDWDAPEWADQAKGLLPHLQL